MTARAAGPRSVAGLALVAGALAGFQVGKVIIALPVIRLEYSIDLGVAGLLVSSYTIVGAVVGLALGRAIDRIGRGRALALGLLFTALGSALGAFAPDLPLLLATRLIEGLGYVGVVVAAPSLITSAGGDEFRRVALSLWGLYLPVGQLVMFLAGPLVLALIGWRGLWAGNAVVLALFATVCLVALPRTTTPSGTAPSIRGVLRSPRVLALAVVFGLYSLQYLAVIGFLPTIYRASGVDDVAAGLLTAIVASGSIAGNLAATVTLHHTRARAGTLIAASSVTMAVAAVVLYALPASALAADVAVATVFMAIGGVLASAVFALVPLVAGGPAQIGPANGLLMQASNVGSLVGAPVLGALASATGTWAYSPVVLSTLALVAGGLALAIRRGETTGSGAGLQRA